MASKVKVSTALFLSLNLLFFALVSSHTSDGSSATNYRSPVLIRPGATYPSGINPEGHGQSGTCNPLNLGVCAKLLGGLVDVELKLGDVPTQPCCSLIHGLADLEAAVCLCTAISANVLGIINLELPISLSLLLNNCGRTPSAEYLCSP